MKFIFLAFLLIVNCHELHAQIPKDSFAGKDEMNSIKLSDYKDFQRKWNLVTVRFREDTKELRFTYANKIAYETLLSKGTDYKDGSVFAKIGYMTSEDPAFPSSITPSGTRRFQLMVRNKIKYKKQMGWGYALFDAGGKTFPEDPDVKINACSACHELVPERGHVFSQPVNFNYEDKDIKATSLNFSKLNFIEVKKENIASYNIIRLNISGSLFVIEGSLQKKFFQGTLDELKPILIKKALEVKSNAGFFSADKKRFVVVSSEVQKCSSGENQLKIIQTMLEKDSTGEYKFNTNKICIQ